MGTRTGGSNPAHFSPRLWAQSRLLTRRPRAGALPASTASAHRGLASLRPPALDSSLSCPAPPTQRRAPTGGVNHAAEPREEMALLAPDGSPVFRSTSTL